MDRVTRSIVEHLGDRITGAVRPVGDLGAELLIRSTEELLAQRLQLLIPRVFVVEFHRARERWGLPVDATSTTAISRYLDGFGPDTIGGWLDRYPVLADLLLGVVDLSAAHVAEVAARWHADRDAVTAAGLGDGSATVTRIAHLGSDAHRGGRAVAAVHLGDGTRVIYKPRSLGVEELVRAAFERISDDVGIDLSPCAPRSLDRGTHGWQREVAEAAATDAGQVRDYYTRLGAACALLTAIGATDMHHENVVAVGDHPVVLDLETALHASTALRAQQLPTAIINRLKLSPANTLLLPQRLPSGPYSVLLGGVGIPYEQRSTRTDRVLVDRDTDAVDVASRTYPFRHRANVLRGPDGAPTDVLDHADRFLDGVRRGVAAVSARREELIARLDEQPVEVRHIARSTAVYGRILDAATHPDHLGDREAFERVIGLLQPPPGLDRRFAGAFVVEAERAALRRADVPYFTLRSDDVRLRAEGRTSPPVADLSPRDRAAHGLRQTGEGSLPLDELLVEEGLAEVRQVRREHDDRYTPAPTGSWGEDLLGADGVDALAVLRRLVDVSVVVDGIDGRERGWVCGAVAPTLATFDPGTSASLHDGGGILIPFERAAAAGCELPGGADELAAEARRGLQRLVQVYRERLEGLPWSVASGLLSVRYLLGHDRPALALPDPAAAREAGGAGGGGAHGGGAATAAGDTMRGAPGAAALLATFTDVPDGDLELLAAGGWGSAPRQDPLDLAHGPLGLRWARHRVATRLGDDAAAAEVAGELAALGRSREPAPAGWCHGHAALCLVGVEAGVDDRDLRWHAEQAATLPAAGEPVDLSVCHGVAGVVQSLVHVAAVRGVAWPVDLASDLWARAAKHARGDGYVTGDPCRQGLLGYFLGWSGIADTGLVLHSALAGSAGWVPAAFASSRWLPDGIGGGG